jgi:hypothetical protein
VKVAVVVGVGRLGMSWSGPVGQNGPQGSKKRAGPIGLTGLIAAGLGSCCEFKGNR